MQLRWAHRILAAVALALASPLLAADPATPATKSPIPTSAAQQTAGKLVDDIYKDDLANAKTSAQKLALAQKMLDSIKDEKNPATLFTVFSKTINLACQAADIQSAYAVIDRMNQDFNIDVLKLHADAAIYIATTAATPEEAKKLLALASPLVDSALNADRFDLAKSIAASLADAARTTADVALQNQAALKVQQVLDTQKACDENTNALTVLAEKPNDPAANLTAGSYLCFVKGNWEKGLPLLAISSDDTLKSLAKTELAGVSVVDDQVKLADGWWDFSEKAAGQAKAQLQIHAAQWYEIALPNVSGLAKVKIEKRAAALVDSNPAVHTASPADVDQLNAMLPKIKAAYPAVIGQDNEFSLLSVYDATTLKRNHGDAEKVAGSYAPDVVVGAGGKIMLWGHYDKLMPGRYLIIYRLQQLAKVTGPKLCFLDVAAGGKTIAERRPDGAEFEEGVWADMPIPLKLDKPTTVEYRYWANNHRVAIDRIYVVKLADQPSSGSVSSKPSTLVASTSSPGLPGLHPPTSTLHPYTTPSAPSAPPLQLPPTPAAPLTPAAPAPTPALVANSSAIERPEFANHPKPIQKNITSITSMMVRVSDDGDTLGLTSDIIAAVAPETRETKDGSAGFNRSKVGEDMKTSFDEAVRAVHLRYPTWEGGRIDVSFGEKYQEHDGGTAGTAFGVLLLSSLEGFDIDPTCAVTGDITVDWKVRKVSAVASKIHGAILDKAQYAAIPAANEDVINDLPLLYGQSSLWDIQTLSIPTLQEAVATLRQDRSPQLAEALKLFATLQPALTKSPALTLRDPATISTLKRILELAPNHLSAKALLAAANNTAPKNLSSSASLYRFSIITYPYRNFISGREQVSRASLPPAVTANARKEIEQLRRIASKEIQPLLTDMAALIEVAEATAAKTARPSEFNTDRDNLLAHLTAVSANRELLEKLVREGY